MKKRFLAALASLAVMVGAGAALIPGKADALVFGGSCGWNTTIDHLWHYSPAFQEYFSYAGRQPVNGRYYRVYWILHPVSNTINQSFIYCG